MKSSALVLLCTSVWLLCLDVSSELPPPERSYNVLMVFPASGSSHINLGMSVAEGLTKRGHKITLLNSNNVSSVNPNITILTHGVTHLRPERLNMFDAGTSLIKAIQNLVLPSWRFARDFYNDETVKNVYKNKEKYDAVIIDFSLITEVAYPFTHQKPFLTLCVAGMNDPLHATAFGNTPHMAYVTGLFHYYRPPFTLWQRIANHVITIALILGRHLLSVAPVQYEISKQFPELPSLWELERNQSVAFINTYVDLLYPQPLLRGQVDIGCIQCKPAKTLPPDLLSFIDGDVPVVYFALGTIVTLLDNHRDTILSVFNQLPYKFLWVYHDEPSSSPSNILVKKYVPQQDVLGHSNVKLYMSHGGFIGVNEAIYHKKPILAIPVFGEQPKASQMIESHGLGLTINWSELSKDLLMNSIVEIITNQSYQRRVAEISALLRDQPNTAEARAVYWTEYAIRHRGAPHLRSPERDLTWIQFFHLDVWVALLLAGYFFLWITRLLRRVTRTLLLLLFCNSKAVTVDKNKKKKKK